MQHQQLSLGDPLLQATDPTALHNFVSTGVVNQQNEVIAYYAGDFSKVSKQYETVVKLKFLSNKDAEQFNNTQKKLLRLSTDPQPIVFRSKEQRLHDVFFKDTGYSGELEEFDCFVGLPSDDNSNPFMSANMKIVDVPRYEHFDNNEYHEHSSYFMYGDKESVFLFHVPTKSPDFFQVIMLLVTCTPSLIHSCPLLLRVACRVTTWSFLYCRSFAKIVFGEDSGSPFCPDVKFIVAVPVTFRVLNNRVVGPVQNPNLEDR